MSTPQLNLRGRVLDLAHPRVMGVLNLTPDSFYATSRVASVEEAARRAEQLVDEGADLIDLGAMSSRPGSDAVPVETELDRLIPVLTAVRDAVDVPLSVDTFRPAVARAAIDAGADLLNDITGLGSGDELARLAAGHGLGLVVMHMRGTPRSMQDDTYYDDLLGEVMSTLSAAVERAEHAGLERRQVVVDPGIGFGKGVEGNLLLLRRLDRICDLGQPVLIGASRKSFIGKLLGVEVDERLPASLAAAVAAVLGGAAIIRAHDVRETVQAVRLAAAIRDTRRTAPAPS